MGVLQPPWALLWRSQGERETLSWTSRMDTEKILCWALVFLGWRHQNAESVNTVDETSKSERSFTSRPQQWQPRHQERAVLSSCPIVRLFVKHWVVTKCVDICKNKEEWLAVHSRVESCCWTCWAPEFDHQNPRTFNYSFSLGPFRHPFMWGAKI